MACDEEVQVIILSLIISIQAISVVLKNNQNFITQLINVKKSLNKRRELILMQQRHVYAKRKRETELEGPRKWKKPTQSVWWDVVVPEFTEKDFVAHFRFTREAFLYIVGQVRDDMYTQDTIMRKALPVNKKVGIALKVFASCAEYSVIASLFGVGKTTVHDCFKAFISSASKRLVPVHIKWPTHEEMREKAEEFERNWNFPMTVGAIDGCHFHICPPKEFATDYYNFKGWYSLSALVICDANYKAMYVKSGFPGRSNDAGAFKKTQIYNLAQEGLLFPQDMVNKINDVDVKLHLLGPFLRPKKEVIKAYLIVA